MGKTYQFVRLKGFQRGAPSKRNTLGAVLAEGLREPTHISHLIRPPSIDWKRIDSPVETPYDFQEWVLEEMENAINVFDHKGATKERRLRSDALAVGAVIASWPEPVVETESEPAYNKEKFDAFVEDTTEWFKSFLEPYEFMVHFRLEHYDEKYPHIHLWFTPYSNDKRTVNWSLAHVCNGPKMFMHTMQKRYYEEVGHKYFDEWARPYKDRKPRVERREAILRREKEEREAMYKLKSQEPTYRLFSVTLETLDKLNSGDEPFDENRLTPVARKILHRFQLMPDKVVLENQRQVSTQKEVLTKDTSDSSEKEEGGPTFPAAMLIRWNQALLLPAFIQAIQENQGQAQHLDREDWLSIVIAETRDSVEADLTQMGLTDHPLGAHLIAELNEGNIVEALLAQSEKSLHERVELLTKTKDSPDLRQSTRDNDTGSSWDSVIPR